jgi:GNAT superfamily N-acetyltransferase
MAVTIEPFSESRRGQAIALVDRVFPSQSLMERLSLRLFATPQQWLLKLAGFSDGRFWLAVRDDDVVGTVGLYRRREDRSDALWLGWFCVAPEARGEGVGGRLLALAKGEARAADVNYLRLYTSTDPNERAAQDTYERAGLEVVRREQPLLWKFVGVERLIRQLDLQAAR